MSASFVPNLGVYSSKPFCGRNLNICSSRRVLISSRIARRQGVVRCSYNINVDSAETGTKGESQKNTQLGRLKQALVTREDQQWIHKICGAAHLGSSAILIATLIATSIDAGGLPDIPADAWFSYVLVLWVFSTSIQGINGSILALRYRNVREEQSLFVGTGLSCVVSGWIAWFGAPSFPMVLRHGPATPVVISSLCLACVLLSITAVLDAPAVVRQRLRDRNGDSMTRADVLSGAAYLAPYLIAAPLYWSGFKMLVLRGYDEFAGLVSQMPHLDSFAVYNNVLWGVAATVASFVVTLRDRKVISSATELGCITVSGVGALVFYVAGLLSLPEWWRLL